MKAIITPQNLIVWTYLWKETTLLVPFAVLWDVPKNPKIATSYAIALNTIWMPSFLFKSTELIMGTYWKNVAFASLPIRKKIKISNTLYIESCHEMNKNKEWITL
jgi:hypothetical protein